MKILIQFESGPNTRWLYRPEEVRKQLEGMGRSVANAMTEGSLPKVFAIVEEEPEPLVTVCAWCFPGDHRPGITHGICKKHLDMMLGKKTEQPKETTCDLQP